MRLRYWLLALAGLLIGFGLIAWWLSPRLVATSPDDEMIGRLQEIRLEFSSPVRESDVLESFSITPSVSGEVRVEDETVVFAPDSGFEYGATYTVGFDGGIRAANGLPTLRRYEETFEVRDPVLIFLRETDDVVDVWIKIDDETTRQLTDEENGIWDYNVLPDGSGVVVSSIDSDGSDDLAAVGLEGEREKLLDCVDHRCRDGRWQPGGSLVAYERQPLEGALGATEVWLLDSESGETWPAHDPAILVELGSDSLLSRFPRWSADGQKLAYFKPDVGLIVVKDFVDDDPFFIPANVEMMAEWSPVGSDLAYIEQTLANSGEDHEGENDHESGIERHELVSHLVMADIVKGTAEDMSAGLKYNDGLPSWRSDGGALVLSRSLPGQSRQIWLLDLNSQESHQLSEDFGQHHGAPVWSPDGGKVAFMKADAIQSNTQPSIWALYPESGESRLIGAGAFLPGWMP